MMLFAIAMGGALGATLRYLTVLGTARVLGAGFPYGTMTVNVLGSLLMGALAAWVLARGTGPVPAFAMTGVLGGFTTFSAFSLDAVLLVEAGRVGAALAYVALSVALSVGALFLGLLAARAVLA